MTSTVALPRVAARFTRSIHLQRDYANISVGLSGYQVTPLVIQTTERILVGLQKDATTRAFSLIGPYGAGKSAYAVFLAHYLRNWPRARESLMRAHSTAGVPVRALFEGPSLLPVLVGGNNSALRHAVLQAFHQALSKEFSFAHNHPKFLLMLTEAIDNSSLDPQRVANLVEEATHLVAQSTNFQGVALIIDELGQYLNYAARHGDERDLFVLQTLAEMAIRSGSTPCVVLTILHQAFDRYTGTAGVTQRTEWAKVQGRFVELPFLEPVSQMLRMVGRVLCPDEEPLQSGVRREWADTMASVGDKLGLRPADINKSDWKSLVAQTYPVHPTVLAALPLLFRQLAQNERSLFAFLTSQEPWGLQDYLQTTPVENSRLPVYRLPHLYNYVEATLGPSLFSRARGQRWAELAEARALLPDLNRLTVDVLTTIGTLGALGQTRGLRADRQQLMFALADNSDSPEVQSTIGYALDTLEARRQIVYRKHRDSYALWEGSDLDIDGLTQNARREIGAQAVLVKLLEQHAQQVPLVARRHSYQTGTIRHFEARYIDAADLKSPIAQSEQADSDLLWVVPTDDAALIEAQQWATHTDRVAETWCITVVPRRVEDLRNLLLDVAALQNILSNQPELENDRVARREVSSRLAEAQQALVEAINQTYGPGQSRWYWRGQEEQVQTSRQVDDLLSRACDTTYHATPRIWNELIVRRQLSSAAAKARRNLIEAMLDHGDEDRLGLQGYPPERAIYESVLRVSGICRRESDGVWRFGAPPESDPLSLRPVWTAMQNFIDSTPERPQPISELYVQLEAPPFGIKAGLIPILFMASYLANAGEVALYEHGNYVPVPDIALFERVLRQPAYFSIRQSRASGVRVAVYVRLARALAPKALTKTMQPAVLDAVTPLLRLINGLPAYSRTTRNISEQAQAIRLALLDARAPDELLFESLPHACNLPPFAPDMEPDDGMIESFFAALRDGLQELQNAYPQLVERVAHRIRGAFSATVTNIDELRGELLQRYHHIAAVASDSQIRALGVRLENAEGGNAWVESVAALIGRKPLDTWQDGDVTNFELHVTDLGRRFRVIEQVAIANQAVPPDTPLVRVGVADARGERSAVIQTKRREPRVQRLYDELKAVLAQYDTLTIEQRTSVLTELLQPLLDEVAKEADRL